LGPRRPGTNPRRRNVQRAGPAVSRRAAVPARGGRTATTRVRSRLPILLGLVLVGLLALPATPEAHANLVRSEPGASTAAPPAPPGGAAEGTTFTPPTPAEVVVKWLTLLAAAAFTGALGLRWFVWAPALRRVEGRRSKVEGRSNRSTVGSRRSADGRPGAPARSGPSTFDLRPSTPEIGPEVERRLALLAGGALLALLLATVIGLLLQTAKLTGALSPGALSDFLFRTRAGGIWSVRLLLPLVGVMLLGPLLAEALHGPVAQ